jgi:hypothetical protein
MKAPVGVVGGLGEVLLNGIRLIENPLSAKPYLLTQRRVESASSQILKESKEIPAVKTFILILLLLWVMPLTCYAQPNSWRGLTPLRSTRADVERRWGHSSSPCECSYFTEDKNEYVMIVYSDGHCDSLGWNIPKDTVISISVTPRKDRPLLSDLNVDLTKYCVTAPRHWTIIRRSGH